MSMSRFDKDLRQGVREPFLEHHENPKQQNTNMANNRNGEAANASKTETPKQ